MINTLRGGGISGPWLNGFGLEGGKEYPYQEPPDTTSWSVCSSTWDSSPSSMEPLNKGKEFWYTNLSSQDNGSGEGVFSGGYSPVVARRKRRRIRCIKNQQEVGRQRMTHITVERNRRKQMNGYLAVLRSMMPPSYAQRGDQASIVGGAINFVKELEQLLQSLEARKKISNTSSDTNLSSIFSDFFAFPQYSYYSNQLKMANNDSSINNNSNRSMADQERSAIADVEVTMVESHANLKILTRNHPKQLLKMVTGLYSIGLSILHLNVTTLDHTVLYSFSVKVEDECQLTSVNEIATALYEMVGRFQEEATLDLCSYLLTSCPPTL